MQQDNIPSEVQTILNSLDDILRKQQNILDNMQGKSSPDSEIIYRLSNFIESRTLMTDQKKSFTRSRKGYDPQEVDAEIIELQKQIVDLKQRNDSLSNAFTQYSDKISQLTESTKQLQDERIRESLRMTGLINAAARIAEQTEQDALNKANEIIENAKHEAADITENARLEEKKIRGQAQANLMTAHIALTKLNNNSQTIRQSYEQYITETNTRLSEIDMLVNNALNGIPAEPPSYTSFTFVPPTDEEPQTNSFIST